MSDIPLLYHAVSYRTRKKAFLESLPKNMALENADIFTKE